MTEWNQYSVLETPEHLMIQHLSKQIRERIDKLEWMIGTLVSPAQRELLEDEWRSLRNAADVRSSESDKASSPPMP